ncbi:MAG: hypothetical protein K6E97_03870 [Treponema sp.]|nr:hypothetical protein [Treponema sp.]
MNTNSLSVNSFQSLAEISGNSNTELMTTKQVAFQLNTSPKVILENAKKCLPNKKIKNGKPTYWNEAEITILLEHLKGNQTNQNTFTGAVKAVDTSLTPSLRMMQAMEMFKAAADEEIARLRSENIDLSNYKADVEKKIANCELVETPSENARNHLWQNIQKVGSVMNNYSAAWHEFWNLVKRDTSIDVKTRASNKDMKPMDYICNELDISDFKKIYALSEKMKNEYCEN